MNIENARSIRLLSCGLALAATAVGCIQKKTGGADVLSETEAIAATSNRFFGKNVRGYMWALSVPDIEKFRVAGAGVPGRACRPS